LKPIFIRKQMQSENCQNSAESDQNSLFMPEEAKCRLVLPHYQSYKSLKRYLPVLLQALDAAKVPVEVILVDDGSHHLVQKMVGLLVDRLRSQHPTLLPVRLLEKNCGKGYAIRQGWEGVGESVQLLAFVDADGSIPSSSVAEQIKLALVHPDELRCAIRPSLSKQTRSFKRQLTGRLFSRHAIRQLNLTVSDPQCGFKMVPAAVYRRLQRRFKIDRFAFDCELLAHFQQVGIKIVEDEVPWKEARTSTVRAFRDGFQMLWDLRKLKRRLALWKRL